MKSVIWTEGEINQNFSALATLSEVIGFIEKDCSNRGEVVCEVTVNGVTLNEEDESRFAAITPGEIKSLSVKVSGFGDLLDESVAALWSYIPEMIRVSLLASEKFRAEDIEGATKTFQAIVNGSTWLVDMLNNLRKNKVVELRGLSDLDWTQAETNLLSVIRQMINALEAKDYVLLADVLEYDWITVLQDWLRLLGQSPTGVRDGDHGQTPSNFMD